MLGNSNLGPRKRKNQREPIENDVVYFFSAAFSIGRKTFFLHLCKQETCIYNSLAAIYGLTAINTILVAG